MSPLRRTRGSRCEALQIRMHSKTKWIISIIATTFSIVICNVNSFVRLVSVFEQVFEHAVDYISRNYIETIQRNSFYVYSSKSFRYRHTCIATFSLVNLRLANIIIDRKFRTNCIMIQTSATVNLAKTCGILNTIL